MVTVRTREQSRRIAEVRRALGISRAVSSGSIIGNPTTNKHKFKVGDIIRGIEDCGGDYSITNEDATMEVVTIYNNNRIRVKILTTDDQDKIHGIGREFNVESKYFKLVSKSQKETPKKQVIKYQPGTRIGDYVRKLIGVEKDAERLRWLKTFDNCVLSQSVRDTIDEALTVVLRRDLFEKWGLHEHFEKGITNSILIYGPPGTGKTMVSESIAAVLGKNLMIISSATIQSNIPGQSERNMTESFEKATQEDAVILFDECDSIFYNRDAVGAILSAEINHFLTEIERFDGVVLLTTNRLHKLDGALQRRVIAKIELGLPDAKTREKIWKKLIPEKMPTEKLDFKKLAKAALSGGDIKNVVILAARKGIAKNKEIVEMCDFEVACDSVVMAKRNFESVQPKRVPNQEIISDKTMGSSLTETMRRTLE